VVDDQLAAAGEQVEQGDRAIGSLERVVLRDGRHRQLTPCRGQLVAGLRQCLLLGQQILSGVTPFGTTDHSRQVHDG
jgi:hypothetical protein